MCYTCSCLFDGIDSIVEDWIVDQVHIPEVETGYENVLLVRLLLKMRMHSFQKSLVFEGLTVEGILKNWSKIKPMIVKDWSENIDARFHLFGKVRDEWIDKDLFDYLDCLTYQIPFVWKFIDSCYSSIFYDSTSYWYLCWIRLVWFWCFSDGTLLLLEILNTVWFCDI
ncbi:hypothetical protein KPL70_014638 [Citrus sinensis]|nr:hypothetical protein KPL70_014638 [Citrus sinensis]